MHQIKIEQKIPKITFNGEDIDVFLENIGTDIHSALDELSLLKIELNLNDDSFDVVEGILSTTLEKLGA